MLFKVNNVISEIGELQNRVQTPLGDIQLEFHISELNPKNNIQSYKIKDGSFLTRYENEFCEAELLVSDVSVPLNVEKCVGVVWRFKLKQAVKRLSFQAAFLQGEHHKSYDGQHHGDDLYALKWHDHQHQLHIGTQDNDMLHERIMQNDYFPVNSDYLFNPFYEDQDGLSIILENIEVGKIGQVQFVISWSNLEHELASWFGVDLYTKEILPLEVDY